MAKKKSETLATPSEPKKSKQSKPKKKLAPVPVQLGDPSLQIANPLSAGIDLHLRDHWVCVPAACAKLPPKDHPANLPANVRAFGTCTGDLERLADWLAECGITTVAMESTGVYWIPLFELLERRGFQVFLVNPVQTRQVTGRPKSDVLDCQWIQRLHSYGLLTASFRPGDQTCVLRSYLRQRQMLIADAGRSVQHMQKALEQMNIKLATVVDDITGATGMLILRAILAGNRDPKSLVKFRHKQCKSSSAKFAEALRGNWRDEHLFSLQQAMATYDHLRQQLTACDGRIEAFLKEQPDLSDGREFTVVTSSKSKSADAKFDVQSLLFRWTGIDLLVIEGIGGVTALNVLSEIGTDMSKWPTEKHFSSWLGLCPQHRGSGQRVQRRRTRGGANRAAQAFRMAAQGCHGAKNAMGAYYRRIQARAGGHKAVTATAHKIACRVYRLLKYGEKYVRQEIEEYETKFRAKQAKNLAKKATEMGYKLVPIAVESSPAI